MIVTLENLPVEGSDILIVDPTVHLDYVVPLAVNFPNPNRSIRVQYDNTGFSNPLRILTRVLYANGNVEDIESWVPGNLNFNSMLGAIGSGIGGNAQVTEEPIDYARCVRRILSVQFSRTRERVLKYKVGLGFSVGQSINTLNSVKLVDNTPVPVIIHAGSGGLAPENDYQAPNGDLSYVIDYV